MYFSYRLQIYTFFFNSVSETVKKNAHLSISVHFFI